MSELGAASKVAERRGLIGTLAAIAIIVSVVLASYREFWPKASQNAASDSLPVVAPPVAGSSSTSPREENGNIETLSVEKVQLTPVDFSLPSALYLELRNNGMIVAGTDLLIDLGQSTLDTFEVRSTASVEVLSASRGASALKFRVFNVDRDESVYLYALVSSPSINRIILNPLKGGVQTVLTLDDIRATSWFSRLPAAFRFFLWVVLAGIVIAVLGTIAHIVGALMDRLAANAGGTPST